MNDNIPTTDADRYRALSNDAYAAAERLTDSESQLIMRQIALSYYRLSLIADERDPVTGMARPPTVSGPKPAMGTT